MPIAACIEWIFKDEHPEFPDRVRACAAAGLQGVEIHMWRAKPEAELRRALDQTGLVLTSMLVEPRVQLVTTEGQATLLQSVRESAAAARRFGARALVVASGMTMADRDPAAQSAAIVANLKAMAPICEDAGITLLFEPVNTRVDHPGVFTDRTLPGLDLIEETDRPGVRLLYDIYHSAAMGERPEEVLASRVHLIGHVQAADHPGRNQPGSGGIDFPHYFTLLRGQGYQGFVGLEYRPTGPSLASLQQTRKAFGG
ncbi:MAG: TIM barrel protein [Gammaproteobacteria bacterium]|nr:TIM barrel protein [Gammaproteobacteria bacterium]